MSHEWYERRAALNLEMPGRFVHLLFPVGMIELTVEDDFHSGGVLYRFLIRFGKMVNMAEVKADFEERLFGLPRLPAIVTIHHRTEDTYAIDYRVDQREMEYHGDVIEAQRWIIQDLLNRIMKATKIVDTAAEIVAMALAKRRRGIRSYPSADFMDSPAANPGMFTSDTRSRRSQRPTPKTTRGQRHLRQRRQQRKRG